MTLRLRILQVTAHYFPSVGGTEIHTHEVARRLVRDGHDVTIVTTPANDSLPAAEYSEGIRILRAHTWSVSRSALFAPDIARIVEAGGWDIVHCQGYHTLVSPLAIVAARRARLPYVVTMHSGGHSSPARNAARGLQLAMLRPLLLGAERLIAMSRFELTHLSSRLRIPVGRFDIIPSGSELPALPTTLMPKPSGRLILSVGRLERYKGHQRVLAALPRVLESCPDVRLRILGTGPYEPALRRMAREYGVAEQIDIEGIPARDRQRYVAVLASADLVVVLSEYESLGLSALEAAAAGRPLLVANTTALGELVELGFATGVRPDSDAAEVAAAILGQLLEPLVPPPIRVPTWDDCERELLSVYMNVVRRRRGAV